jgi:hypothetical protein
LRSVISGAIESIKAVAGDMENAKMTMQYRTPWTPAQHRQAAKKLRSLVSHPRAASPERLEQMAQNHETMARVREGQAILARVGGRIADLRKDPSIIPDCQR